MTGLVTLAIYSTCVIALPHSLITSCGVGSSKGERGNWKKSMNLVGTVGVRIKLKIIRN